MMRRRRVLLALFGVLLLLVAGAAFARVGGGDSYSGSSSSSGSGGNGGGSGGGEILYLIVRMLFSLTIHHPAIGIPLDVLFIVVVVRWSRKKRETARVRVVTRRADAQAGAAARLEDLRNFDPNFSEITFSDFAYSLYARTHTARGNGTLDQYAPYLSDGARNVLRSRNPQNLREVRGVVIGAMNVTDFRGIDKPLVLLGLVFEANYTEVAGGEQSWYVREQWVLERKRDILSPPPEKAKADHCPRCGAALQTRTDGACTYCGAKIDSGAFDWYVRSIVLLERETRGPLLTSNVPEQGTDLPTRYQARFADRRRQFEAEHPGFDWASFDRRVRGIAVELQSAWTARDWERVRPLETDSLFQMHRYWIDAYRRQRLRNVVAQHQIGAIEPVRITGDAFYESITVRMYASGFDSTVDESGNVVAGSDSRERRWSEYWTFIRSRGASGGTSSITCPNCGAKVAAGSTGICVYCGGKLTTGTFDWVLSRIEQDEAFVA